MRRFAAVLAVCLLGALPSHAQSDRGGLIERSLERRLSQEGRDVEITGLKVSLSGKARAESVTIADEQGVWLNMADVALDWSQVALARGRLKVSEMSAQTLELSRLPERRPRAEASDFTFPELPVEVDIENISIGQFVIGAGLSGQPKVLSLNGRFSYGDDGMEAVAEIDWLDGSGELAFDATYSSESGTISLDATLTEDADGVIANLIGLPGAPAVDFELSGSGVNDAFSAEFQLATDGIVRLSGSAATFVPAEDGDVSIRLVAEAEGNVSPLFDEGYDDFFGDNLAFSLQISGFDDGSLSVDRMEMTTAAASLSAGLNIDANGVPLSANVDASLGLPNGELVVLPLPSQPIRLESASLHLGFDSDASERWEARFELHGLRRGDTAARAVNVVAGGDVQSEPVFGITASFQAEILDYSGSGGATEPLLTASAEMNWFEHEYLSFPKFSLSADSFELLGGAEVGWGAAGPVAVGGFELDASRLSGLTSFFGFEVNGQVVADADFVVEPLTGAFDLGIAARTERLSSGQPVFDKLMENPTEISGLISRGTDGIDVLLDRLSSATLDASGKTKLSSGTSTLVLEIGLPRANALFPGVSFPLDVAAQAEGQGGVWTVSVDMELPGAQVSASSVVDTEQPESTVVVFNGLLEDLASYVPALAGPASFNGSFGPLAASQIPLEVFLSSAGFGDARASGTIARDFESFALDVEGSLRLEAFSAALSPNTVRGEADFNLNLRGSLNSKDISGRIETTGARFSAPSVGILLEDLRGEVVFGGGQAELSIDARSPAGGSISVRGVLRSNAPYRIDASVGFRQLAVRKSYLYETSVTGDLFVQGPLLGGATISGTLNLGETNIRIPESVIGGAGAIPEVVHINEPPPVRATRMRAGLIETGTEEKGAGAMAPFRLNINIYAPNQVFLRGRGISAEFGGQIKLLGTTREVTPNGSFKLIRGSLNLPGKTIAIERANIYFLGSFDITLDIAATTQSGDYRITVLVLGPLSSPSVQFVSDPELPPEEVVSQLIFGRALQDVSALQVGRLVIAVRTLSGQGGEGLVESIRQGSRLAELDVRVDDEGDVQLRAGGYIRNNVYAGFEVDTGGDSALSINLDLTPNVKVRSAKSNSGETWLGIYYEVNY